MLRNHLVTALAERDNDPVSVSVSGFLIDVVSVSYTGGHIVLILDPEEMGDVLELIVAGDPGPGEIPPGPSGHWTCPAIPGRDGACQDMEAT